VRCGVLDRWTDAELAWALVPSFVVTVTAQRANGEVYLLAVQPDRAAATVASCIAWQLPPAVVLHPSDTCQRRS